MVSAVPCASSFFFAVQSVFEHVTQEFLHGSVADGPVEEKQLNSLRVDEAQRRQEEEELPEPEESKSINQSINQVKLSNGG